MSSKLGNEQPPNGRLPAKRSLRHVIALLFLMSRAGPHLERVKKELKFKLIEVIQVLVLLLVQVLLKTFIFMITIIIIIFNTLINLSSTP